MDKLNNIILNLDKSTSTNNRYLKKNILNGNIFPSKVPFLSPQDIHPKCWSDLEKKIKLREYKKSHMAATDLYKCYKCGESKCKITQLQTRGADEPITNFITCLVCGNTFKQ
jgi:transcription elongation factor S-II